MNLSGFYQENKKYHLQLCQGYWVSDILGMPGYRPNWITRGSVTIYNHNCDKICDMLGFFKIRTKEISRVFWLVVKKKTSRMSAWVRWHVLSNYSGMMHTVL